MDGTSLKLWISREKEAEIPNFKSNVETKKKCKEKYGDAFRISESFNIDGEQVFSYMYIVDKEKFNEMQVYIKKHNTRFIDDGNLILKDSWNHTNQF